MSTVFKPRRSNKGRMDQTGTTGKYANAVLGAGELFLERQQTGTTYTEGSGTSSSPVQYRMKIGDGSTKYSSLGYADQTQVSASGSSGDGNIVGNVAQNTSNGGITTTFQSLADKKVSSVTSNSSTTVANALNTVSANNTLKDILGALKQAVSLCNTAITSLNDDLIIVDNSYPYMIKLKNKLMIQYGHVEYSSSSSTVLPIYNSSITVGARVNFYTSYANKNFNNSGEYPRKSIFITVQHLGSASNALPLGADRNYPCIVTQYTNLSFDFSCGDIEKEIFPMVYESGKGFVWFAIGEV